MPQAAELGGWWGGTGNIFVWAVYYLTSRAWSDEWVSAEAADRWIDRWNILYAPKKKLSTQPTCVNRPISILLGHGWPFSMNMTMSSVGFIGLPDHQSWIQYWEVAEWEGSLHQCEAETSADVMQENQINMEQTLGNFPKSYWKRRNKTI